MDVQGVIDSVPAEVPACRRCNSLFQAASAELSAYIAAVEQGFGQQAAKRAGEVWVDLLERSSTPDGDARSAFRRITILAANHLADAMT